MAFRFSSARRAPRSSLASEYALTKYQQCRNAHGRRRRGRQASTVTLSLCHSTTPKTGSPPAPPAPPPLAPPPLAPPPGPPPPGPPPAAAAICICCSAAWWSEARRPLRMDHDWPLHDWPLHDWPPRTAAAPPPPPPPLAACTWLGLGLGPGLGLGLGPGLGLGLGLAGCKCASRCGEGSLASRCISRCISRWRLLACSRRNASPSCLAWPV